jgi:hypothetical protein
MKPLPSPPLPPDALLNALAAPLTVIVVAVEFALPPLPADVPEAAPPMPPVALLVALPAPLVTALVAIDVAFPPLPPESSPPPPLPPLALLLALPALPVIVVVAVEVALPPLPLGGNGQQVFVLPPPAPALAVAVLVASGPGPGPALAVASEPFTPGGPSGPVTVMSSAMAIVVPSASEKIKERADSHCPTRNMAKSSSPGRQYLTLTSDGSISAGMAFFGQPVPATTYVPVLGGIAATAGLLAYYSRVSSPNFQKISWKNLLVFLGFLPYLFLIYVIVFFGLYAIYRGVIVSFSIWTVLAGIFWIAMGYRGISELYLMTEIVKQHGKTHPPIR